MEIGKHVGKVKVGDMIVVTTPLQGTWSCYNIYNQRCIQVVPPKIPLPEAAMLANAPSAAYRMLKDYRTVHPGETVVQNAANSPIGQCVIQLCKAWDIKTINIVANHCGYEAVRDHLCAIGGTVVCTLAEAEEMCDFTTSLNRPILGLNCLGGRFEDVMLKMVKRYGDIVYYGAAYDLPMAKQFLRCDVTFDKFHLTNFNNTASCVEKERMFQEIIQLIVVNKFIAPIYQPVELKNYVHAIRNTSFYDAFCTSSFIFDFTLPP